MKLTVCDQVWTLKKKHFNTFPMKALMPNMGDNHWNREQSGPS